jgi:hypothetical protein
MPIKTTVKKEKNIKKKNINCCEFLRANSLSGIFAPLGNFGLSQLRVPLTSSERPGMPQDPPTTVSTMVALSNLALRAFFSFFFSSSSSSHLTVPSYLIFTTLCNLLPLYRRGN